MTGLENQANTIDVGDLVHNVPYDKYGVIVEELNPIMDASELGADKIVERRFEVLYEDGDLTLTGSTFLQRVVK
jgi:hypothetical protein